MVAILADGLVVRCASLGPTVAAPSRRRTRFCPDTVDVFAWPMDQYDLTTRSVRYSLFQAVCQLCQQSFAGSLGVGQLASFKCCDQTYSDDLLSCKKLL
jgi:hypothetical protein